jgi:hypothetical protein
VNLRPFHGLWIGRDPIVENRCARADGQADNDYGSRELLQGAVPIQSD